MKLTFATATALGLAMAMSSAFAADRNQLYIDQNGSNNVLHSTQSGNDNVIGTEAGPTSPVPSYARGNQGGSYNTLEIIQTNNHNIGSSRNRGIDQLGSHGYMRLEQTGSYNETAGMQQFGSYNDMRIYQQSNGNYVYSAVQDSNSAPTVVPSNAMQIIQRGGSGNTITMANQDGMANRMYLTQNGVQNSIGSATQGVYNAGPADQTTNGYMAINQTGSYNVVNSADQDGDHNSMTLNVNGSSNGTTAFGSSVASAVSGISTVGQGSLHQDGIGNILNVALNASDTSFSFSQTGNYDTLTGNVNFGFGNELATNQHDGTGNSIGFQVGGNNNALGFDQTGSNNSISATQSGNSNVASVNQAGMNNISTISQQ